MSAEEQQPDPQPEEQQDPCVLTVERVGDLVVLVIPANGLHYEVVLSASMAIRLGTALIRKGTDTTGDSLGDDLIAQAMDNFEENP